MFMYITVKVVWIVLAMIFLAAEVMTLSLTMVWFSIGAVAALATSYFTDSIPVQIGVFLVVSLVLLFVVTKMLIKEDRKKGKFWGGEDTNAQSFVGKSGFVVKPITKHEVGQVKVRGEIWSAISEDGSDIGVDEEIVVSDIKGVKLVVKKA